MRLALKIALLSAASALILMAPGCSGKRYETWRTHDTMYASWSHAKFSMRNICGKKRVTAEDLRLSVEEGWWGEEVVVPEPR